MNFTLNSTPSTSPVAPDAALVAAPASAAVALPVAGTEPAPAAPAMFAQWLGLGQQVDAVALPADAEPQPGADVEAAPEAAELEGVDQTVVAVQQDATMLAAMAMPLMAPVAAPAFARLAPAAPAGETTGAESGALPLSAAELRTGLRTAAVPLAAAPAGARDTVAADAPAVGARDAAPVTDAAPAAAAAAAGAVQPAPVQARMNAPAAPVAPAAPAGSAEAVAAAAKPDAAQPADAGATATSERPSGAWGVGAATSAPVRAAADTVTLAGPPTAWRQALHEALGERLDLQLTKGAEQAVIRLDPPMLGRVEIAIRHSAGALEVSISATHSEVVRQLNAVSENLRGDLAQRQFTDVAVTVTQAARNAQAAPQGEQQHRGRQPAREEQPQEPGRALAEAGEPGSTFSLNGRA